MCNWCRTLKSFWNVTINWTRSNKRLHTHLRWTNNRRKIYIVKYGMWIANTISNVQRVRISPTKTKSNNNKKKKLSIKINISISLRSIKFLWNMKGKSWATSRNCCIKEYSKNHEENFTYEELNSWRNFSIFSLNKKKCYFTGFRPFKV